ncbi:Isochorismatase-like protein [Dipodascopsis tothii]|uniref:Isochorismatase-like protein n=1 Tax=Dipodascopsis tothii TaxID=44089 RepID=UPI0034CD9FD6
MATLQIPTAKPGPFPLPAGKTALIVIDMQKDFLYKGGYGYLQCPSADTFAQVASVIEPVAKVLAASRKLGFHIIHTREGHVEDLSDCPPSKRLRQVTANEGRHVLCIGDDGPMGRLLVRGSFGHDIVDELTPLKDEVVLDKPGKGCFYNTDLHQILVSRGITHVLFTGVTAECCVATTFREANDHGFECCTLVDCTDGFDGKIVSATLDMFCAYDGLLGYVANSQPILDLAAAAAAPAADTADMTVTALRAAYRAGVLKPDAVLQAAHSAATALSAAPLALTPLDEAKTSLGGVPEGSADLPYFYGVPFAVTANVAPTSTVVQKLLALGGVMLGTAATPAAGAAAVAAGVVSFAVTSDVEGETLAAATAGGLIGYDVSHGLIPARGVELAVPSYETIAVVTKTIADSRAFFAELRGEDLTDPTSVPDRSIPIKSIDFRGPAKGGFRFAVPFKYALAAKLSPDDLDVFNKTLAAATANNGVEVEYDWSALEDLADIVLGETGLYSLEKHAFSKDPDASAAVAAVPAFKTIRDLETVRVTKTEFYTRFLGAAGVDVVLSPVASPFVACAAALGMCSVAVAPQTVLSAPMGMDGRLLDIAALF